MKNRIVLLCFILLPFWGFAQKPDPSLRSLLPQNWWQSTAGLKVVTLKKNLKYGHEISLDPKVASNQLDEIKTQGFQAIEIFAPAEGLFAYNGLDTKNHYQIDPELGNMDDLRRLIRMAHEKRIAVIAFINLGYFSTEAPDWIEACKDKKAGKNTDKVKWFLWSDKADLPRPPTQEDIYVNQEQRDKAKDYWGWHWSELAGSYFWSRWKANDSAGNTIPLPQLNWSSAEWRQEAKKIVKFWMNIGLDGMLIDAPLCYPYQTWEHNRAIVDIIKEYGNVMIDAEGGRDQAWITESGYNCIHEYGLSFKTSNKQWQKDATVESIETGNPQEIEYMLLQYHDKMLNAGAVLYARGLQNFNGDTAKRHLQQALLAGIGDVIVYTKLEGLPDKGESEILRLKSQHSALYPVATRRHIATNDDKKYYAFLKTAKDGSERILAVYNFQPTPQTIQVELGVFSVSAIIDLVNRETIPVISQFKPLKVELPAYGYRFFNVIPEK
ncbi:MAG TPA: alpha-amylase family glycosyl hydrolase [Prolixibacteraceae bacterium]|nr:alpha-amylase family glycosyl hydrolase [Prolixibacteraceae bacterium]